MGPVLVKQTQNTQRVENGTPILLFPYLCSDNVRRWESENGYEMFRFNVPGKGIFSKFVVKNRKEFWTPVVLRKGRQQGDLLH